MHKPCLLAGALLFLWSPIFIAPKSGVAGDWVSSRSYYTHDPFTGRRVNQYAPIGPFFYPRGSQNYQESAYHHYRSSIRAGGVADNYHVVREYGRPVRPYGEWQFPYRPYSVPYDQWGPPLSGVNVNVFGRTPRGISPGLNAPGTFAPGGSPGGFVPGAYAPFHPASPHRAPR